MSPIELNQFSEQLIRDAAFGLGFLAIVIVLNSCLFIQIFLWFVRLNVRFNKLPPYKLIFLFAAAVFLMSLVQMTSIVIWTIALYANSLIEDIRPALLFAGSSYTTLGIYSDILPTSWKSVAFYISFSGLFSFAIATSAMVAMLSIIIKRVYKLSSRH